MIITQTPLRISFFGGGTDFKEFYEKEEGFVVSTAIDKYIFVIVKERFDDFIYVNYSKKERVETPEQIEHDLVREAMLKTKVQEGIEITILADIPSEGSGLGSSSSLIVGLLNAFYQYKGEQVTAKKLAEDACEIEIDICKRPIGKQDQYIAAYGGLASIGFNKDESVKVKKFEISNYNRRLLGSNLMLFFTGMTRSSSDILTEQKFKTKSNTQELLHLKELAKISEETISKGKFELLGKMLDMNWMLKKKLSSNIANSNIDKMYEIALNAGASGGKIAGAGGGGFLLLYCEREKQSNVRNALKEFKEMPFILEKDGSKVIFNYRQYSWK